MEDKTLNEKESLELITKMIQNTKHRMEQNSGLPLILWGTLTVFFSVLIWSLFKFGIANSPIYNLLWLGIPILGWIGMVIILKTGTKKRYVKTFIDKVINYIWLVLGMATFILCIVAYISHNIPILFIIALLMTCGVAITNLIINFKTGTWCGVIGILLSPLCIYFKGLDSLLIFALIFGITMIIPGIVLQVKSKKYAKGT
jgi:hypothetical protein